MVIEITNVLVSLHGLPDCFNDLPLSCILVTLRNINTPMKFKSRVKRFAKIDTQRM